MAEGKFNSLKDNSKIFGIGSLFRKRNRKTWAINVDFNDGSTKAMQFSNIPVLARKRVLNSTKTYKTVGKKVGFLIEDARQWRIAKASDCPAYQAHTHGKDANQLCFVVEDGSTSVFIPQLELARALFYHDPFLARLSLQHNALSEDFFIQQVEEKISINVREGAEYPIYYYNQDDNRRFLSWVLLDSAARASFESISVHLIKNQRIDNAYQKWNFQFLPPPLSGVELEARGWSDYRSNTFFIWEITKLNNLPSNIDREIDFFHPAYERQFSGNPIKVDAKKGDAPNEFDLHDDELAGSGKTVIPLMSDKVMVSFKNPHITNRVLSKVKLVNSVTGSGEKKAHGKDLSPNEKDESGELPGGAWNNLDDQTDDTHLYIGKFESFFKMVDCLVVEHGFKLVRQKTRKLPKLGSRKKHWLSDSQNPRCLTYVELENSCGFYTLLEIDTSDGATKLSTMLLKSSPGWLHNNEKQVLRGIMKRSLGWPTDYFKKQLGEKAYIGIPHPQSKGSGVLPHEAIAPWAQRVVSGIKRID